MKLNFSNLIKDKLTGEELGKLMLKDSMSIYMQGLTDKDVLSGKKEPTHLLKEYEVKDMINKLSGDYNIKVYNNYRELLNCIRNFAISQIACKYEIEVASWKLAFCFFARDKFPITSEDILHLKKAIIELNDYIRGLFFYTAVFQLIAEFTKISDISYLPLALPEDLVKIVNILIEGYNYANKADLPMIEVNPISEERIHQALEEIKSISDLYNENTLRELLIPEEVCI